MTASELVRQCQGRGRYYAEKVFTHAGYTPATAAAVVAQFTYRPRYGQPQVFRATPEAVAQALAREVRYDR